MTVLKQNPRRWYYVMMFCIVMSFLVFAAGPRLNYPQDTIRDIGLWIGLLAPSMGVMGVRAELMGRK